MNGQRTGEKDSIEYLFPLFTEMKENEKRMNYSIQTEDNKARRSIPMFRYIPSRIIMQRIIMRATLLGDDFLKFDEA